MDADLSDIPRGQHDLHILVDLYNLLIFHYVVWDH